jgi:hypothetical protein
MRQREPRECIGSGGAPALRSEAADDGGRMTGECPVCFKRFRLERGLIPKHESPALHAAS